MRRSLSWLVPIISSLCFACGGSGSTGPSGSGTGGGSSTGSMTAGTGGTATGSIPSPGTTDQVDNDFTDVEPNNTPEQATPLGIAAMGDINVWVGGNTIGGSDNAADYFVFKTAATAGTFTFDVCFSAPITGMSATLSKVVGGHEETPPVGSWTSSGTCVTAGATGAALEASTDYLFGLTATGGSGMYGA